MTHDEIAQGAQRLAPWFYPYTFPGGIQAPCYTPAEVQPIFETRRAMVERVIEAHFGDRLAEIDCLDVGCHEGYYAHAFAPRVRRMVGMDYRDESLERARFAAEALGHGNCEFRVGDVERLSPEVDGVYPLTFLLGVLYHLENPMLALRNMAKITGEVCVIETQVIAEVRGKTEWGRRAAKVQYQGVLALIDESEPYHSGNREMGSVPLVTCPSPKGLETMLRHAGFSRVEFIKPPRGAYEQHARGKRVVCAAYR